MQVAKAIQFCLTQKGCLRFQVPARSIAKNSDVIQRPSDIFKYLARVRMEGDAKAAALQVLSTTGFHVQWQPLTHS